MSQHEETREVGLRPTRGDVGESSSSNPDELNDDDTLLRDLIPPRFIPTRRKNVEAPVEVGKGSMALELNCLLQSAVRAMIAAQSQSAPQPTVQVEETPAQKRLKIIKGFSQLMPVMFEGGADPMVAEDYMDQVKTQLTSMDMTEDHLKIILATYKFAKDVKLWWKSVISRYKVEEMSWDKFKELFYEKYFLISKRWELKDQFLGLIQGNMSVAEYENKYTLLSRFVPEMVKDEVDKTQKFVSDLNERIKPLIMAQFIKVYSEAVERALMLEADIKDKDEKREQWKQKRGAGLSSEGFSWKKNKGGSFQFQGQQSARFAPTTPMPVGSDKSGVVCLQCQQLGHYKSSCPMRSSSVSSAPKARCGCGQQGHLLRDCLSQGVGTGSGRGS
ncbi:uncharacterized protein LOC132307185 isoform X1 [Cornus florida]|uniref:uncharacterized protein LOC132307185 isoform X1 n=1 Tax=Cornus florida TaxID=4283 RepID=UPI0028967912|nr:uncharacterized protein LOC132307185 isoform X1 [Cornus florida]